MKAPWYTEHGFVVKQRFGFYRLLRLRGNGALLLLGKYSGQQSAEHAMRKHLKDRAPKVRLATWV